jgi:hypothetical protein
MHRISRHAPAASDENLVGPHFGHDPGQYTGLIYSLVMAGIAQAMTIQRSTASCDVAARARATTLQRLHR